MAVTEMELDPDEARKQIKEDRKALKREQAAQKKEARARAKEIAAREDDIDDDAGGLSVAMVTVIIIIIWLAIIALLIKLDVGGFGSGIAKPLLKDVPVINLILPEESTLGSNVEESMEGPVDKYGFKDMNEALAYIAQLEAQLAIAQAGSSSDNARVEELEAEIKRLKTFEESQVAFERIKNEFYDEVIYAENAPDISEYQKYYEAIEPEKAERLYKQVVAQNQEKKDMQDYVAAYSAMKPKEAAAIFESMTDNLALAARILESMDSSSRGKILGAMDAEVAAKITKLMDPED